MALNKGSNVHYLLVRAIAAAGLKIRDIEPVYLAPADARAAFERGAVDAWVIWDPFLAAAQAATGARTLIDGTGLVDNLQFYLASRDYAARDPGAVHAVIEELDAADRWAAGNQQEVARLFGPRVGIPAPVLQVALERMGYGVAPVTDEVLGKQQRIADTFHDLGHPEADHGPRRRVEGQRVRLQAAERATSSGSSRPTVTAATSARPSAPARSGCPTCARSRRPPTSWAISASCCRPGGAARTAGWWRARWRR